MALSQAKAHVLVVDDDVAVGGTLKMLIEADGHEVSYVKTGREALSRLKEDEFDLVLLDIKLPDMSGIRVLQEIARATPSEKTPVILITAYASLETAIDGLRAGAFDYLSKPTAPELMMHRVNQALETTRLRREVRWLKEKLRRERPGGLGAIVGVSEAMMRLCELIVKLAENDTTSVLIMGETGTGKGLVARTIHELSRRAQKPFITVNCTAIPHDLFEAEMFGYEKGAFTTAERAYVGCFEQAQGGTLFLDEVGDIPPPIQPKLLNVLEEKRVRRLGSEKDVAVDVRVIAATNQDLQKKVERGQFREDLYYRLNAFPITIAPLRERKEDILPLAYHFLDYYVREFKKSLSGISEEAERMLLEYDYPGNVRELKNLIERAVLLEEGRELTPGSLFLPAQSSRLFHVPCPVSPARQLTRQQVEAALLEASGNKSRAARLLGISRPTLNKKLKEFGLM